MDNPSIWRVSNPSSGSPTTSVYATLPGTPSGSIAFAPSGTMYVWDNTSTGTQIIKVSGTNGPATPTVTPVTGLPVNPSYIGILAGGTQTNGDAAFLVLNYSPIGSARGGIGIVDFTTTPPSLRTILVTSESSITITLHLDLMDASMQPWATGFSGSPTPLATATIHPSRQALR